MNLPLKETEVSSVGHAEELTLIHGALVALRKGDPSAKLPYQGSPGFGKVAEVFNDLVEQNVAMAEELARLSQMVGKEGKLKRRAALQNARGFWAQKIESINSLIAGFDYHFVKPADPREIQAAIERGRDTAGEAALEAHRVGGSE